jgi:hypothetical protein
MESQCPHGEICRRPATRCHELTLPESCPMGMSFGIGFKIFLFKKKKKETPLWKEAMQENVRKSKDNAVSLFCTFVLIFVFINNKKETEGNHGKSQRNKEKYAKEQCLLFAFYIKKKRQKEMQKNMQNTMKSEQKHCRLFRWKANKCRRQATQTMETYVANKVAKSATYFLALEFKYFI